MDTTLNTDILEPISTIIIPATTRKFVAGEKFVVNRRSNARVKISCLGSDFTEQFLFSGGGKIELPISERILRCHRVRCCSVDSSIIAELGGKKKSETTLTEMFYLMEKWGEHGLLLSSGWASNTFYIRNQKAVLRSVNARWAGGGWHVYAIPVGKPDGWRNGGRTFSRDFI
ncbi:MAG: hypothetical protein AAB589_00325 [Patescibacteria group bacterium]